MQREKMYWIVIAASIIANLLIAGFGGIILLTLKHEAKASYPDLKAVTQITEDWETKPFVEISIED